MTHVHLTVGCGMFRNTYQGSDWLSVIGPLTLDRKPSLKGIFSGSLKSVYSQNLRSHVIQLSCRSKKIAYHSHPVSLALTQHNLVVQVFLDDGGFFSVDIVLIDSNHCRRKIRLSTLRKSISVLPALIQAPLTNLVHSTWVNLCLPLGQLVSHFWSGQKLQLLEGLHISGNCCIREIFTTRNPLPDSSLNAEMPDSDCATISKWTRFPTGVVNITQTFGPEMLSRPVVEEIQNQVDTQLPPTGGIAANPKRNVITTKDILSSEPFLSAIFVSAKVFGTKSDYNFDSESKLTRAVPRPFWPTRRHQTFDPAERMQLSLTEPSDVRLFSTLRSSKFEESMPTETSILSNNRRPRRNLTSEETRLQPSQFSQVPELMALEHQIEVTLRGADETLMSDRTVEDRLIDAKYFYSYVSRRFYPIGY